MSVSRRLTQMYRYFQARFGAARTVRALPKAFSPQVDAGMKSVCAQVGKRYSSLNIYILSLISLQSLAKFLVDSILSYTDINICW